MNRFLSALALCAAVVPAQVTGYTFSQSTGVYAPVAGTTIFSGTTDDSISTAIPIGFSFVFNGATHTTLKVNSNGWINPGSAATSGTNYSSISGSTANIVAPFSRDLQGNAGGSVVWALSGAPGSQVFTVQWTNYRRFGATGDNLNFQVKLYEGSNEIEFVYDVMTVAAPTTAQVGLRGSVAAQFNSRQIVSGTHTWDTSVAAALSSNTCALSATLFPVSGKSFKYTPPPLLVVTPTVIPAAPVLSGSFVTIQAQTGFVPGSYVPAGPVTATIDLTNVGGVAGVPMNDLGGGLFEVVTAVSGTTGTKNCAISATDGSLVGGGVAVVSIYSVANDVCTGATPIVGGLNGPFDNSQCLVPNEVGFASQCGVFGSTLGFRDLFFTYTAPCDGTVTMTTCDGDAVTSPGENDDTQLMAYSTWTCGGPALNVPIACNDDAAVPGCGPSGFQSTISFPVLANQTYLVRLAAWGTSDIGSNVINVTLATAQIATIGTGCGVPTAATLTGSGPPVLGSTGTITVTAQANANGLLLFSNPNTAMAYTPFGACTIYLENPGMGILLPIFTDGMGLWSLTATFPADPAFDCVGWDFQALVIGAAGIEFTNGLRLILGT